MMQQIFGIIDRYISKTIFSTTMIVLSILISLSGIIKFIDQLKKAGQGSYDTSGAGIYTLLSVPKDLQSFFPMAVLLGTLLGLGILAQRNELIVIQASGFTYLQIAFSVMKISIPLILINIVISEWVAPNGEKMARNYRAIAMYGDSLVLTQQGIWAKDKNNFIYIEHVKNENELSGINIYAFNDQHCLQSILYAATAVFDINSGLWKLFQVNETNLKNLNQISNLHTVSTTWKTNLTPDKLSSVALDPRVLSIRGLYNYVKYLQASGQNSGHYQFSMWNKIFQPLSVLVMMLVAFSFIFSSLHSIQMSMKIATGIGFSFIFYVLDHTLGPLMLLYGIPPIVGALTPNVIFLLISLSLLLKHS